MNHLLPLLVATALAFFAGCSKAPDATPSADGKPAAGRKLTIALMPKSKGNAYFISCKQGADEAAKALGVELLFDGPTDPDQKVSEIIVRHKPRLVSWIVNDDRRALIEFNSKKAHRRGHFLQRFHWLRSASTNANTYSLLLLQVDS